MNSILSAILWITYALSLYFSVFLILVFFEKRHLFTKKSSEEISNYPKVTIAVPAYNEQDTVVPTLESINQLDYPKEKLQIIAINDGSVDLTKERIEFFIKDKPHFSLLSHKNKGKATSMNLALEQAKGEFFVCLDADSFVDPKSLKKMLALYEKQNDPQLAIITPAMKVNQPKSILQRVQWLEYLVIILIARITSQLDSLYVAPGPFSVYKTDILRKVGGFDPTNIVEDQEIAYRMQLNQYKIKQCPHAYVYTVAPKKLKAFYNQRRRWYLGGLLCLYQYKKLVGNKEYGDFGILQMTKNVVGFLLTITGIGLFLYITLSPLIRWIKNLYLIDFNVVPLVESLTLKINTISLLTIEFHFAFIIISLFAIGAFLFYQAHKNAHEKLLRWGWIPIIPYFLFYYLLKGSILIVAMTQFFKDKKIKW